MNYGLSPHADPDLIKARDEGRLEEAKAEVCICGHPRSEHFGATGALASFGGSACGRCWECPTFHAPRG